LRRKTWTEVIVNGNLFANFTQEMNTNTSTINIGGSVTNSQIGQLLTNCVNSIERQPSGAKKELLEQIAKEVGSIMNALPVEKKDEAGQVAENLELLVKQATCERPQKAWYQVSSAGLLEAASWVKDYSGDIADALGKLGNMLGLSN
jgi:internalin A